MCLGAIALERFATSRSDDNRAESQNRDKNRSARQSAAPQIDLRIDDAQRNRYAKSLGGEPFPLDRLFQEGPTRRMHVGHPRRALPAIPNRWKSGCMVHVTRPDRQLWHVGLPNSQKKRIQSRTVVIVFAKDTNSNTRSSQPAAGLRVIPAGSPAWHSHSSTGFVSESSTRC